MTKLDFQSIISTLIVLGLVIAVYFESGIWTALAVGLAFFRIRTLGAATLIYAENANKAFLSLSRRLGL